MIKYYWFIILVLPALRLFAEGDTLHISDVLYNQLDRIILSSSDQWQFRPGSDSSGLFDWAKTDNWKQLTPVSNKLEYIDENNYLQGWFRIRIQSDSSLKNDRLFLDILCNYGAYDVYFDRNYQYSVGQTGFSGESFQHGLTMYKDELYPWTNRINGTQQISIYFRVKEPGTIIRTLYRNFFKTSFLVALAKRSDRFSYVEQRLEDDRENMFLMTAYLFVFILFFTLWLKFRSEKIYGLICLFSLCLVLIPALNLSKPLNNYFQNIALYSVLADDIGNYLLGIIMPVISATLIFQKPRIKIAHLLPLAIIFFFVETYFALRVSFFVIASIIISIGLLIYFHKRLSGAKRFILYGVLSMLVFGIIGILTFALKIKYPEFFKSLHMFLFAVSLPIGLILYLAARFSEILHEVRENASKLVKANEEKRIQAEHMSARLEIQVAERTSALSQSLAELKSTQAQLIQSEKMASLGELTAGIAHEIQNPLNFVNNFSEVNTELIDELIGETYKERRERDETLEAELLTNILDNEKKISHHGKRAQGIVQNMLEHSRSGGGYKEQINLNALCDEYFRLAYHGMRARDKSFNAELKTHYENDLPELNVIPQDIGRVLLNLFNNAFQAVEKEINPVVSVSTRKIVEGVEIEIADNGPGIPDEIIGKIFQPFFTTKPTGQGTGLGLSLSYDIVKAHGGTIKVHNSPEGGAVFCIRLPTG